MEVLLEYKLFPKYKTMKKTWWFRVIFITLWAYGSETYTDGYLNFGFFEEAKVWLGMLFPLFEVKEVVWLPLVGKPVYGGWH